MTCKPGQGREDSLARTRAGQLGQNNRDRKTVAGQLGQDNRDSSNMAQQKGQDSQFRQDRKTRGICTSKTGTRKLKQNNSERTARTGQADRIG
jgi:hypothetical protein